MPAKEHFITRRIKKTQVDEYFEKELEKAGYSHIDIQKTPLGTRVIVFAARPGIVIGKRGKNVRQMTQTLEEVYNIENPQIEVAEIENPELDARVMSKRLAMKLEKGIHYRRAAYSVLRRVKSAGAKGIEITISGKITSHRARYKKFREGFVAKCGEPALLYVSQGIAYAIMKKGVIGVKVKIMHDAELLPNQVKIKLDLKENICQNCGAEVAPGTVTCKECGATLITELN
ncbi:MAG: 30S ribosomal protein S3 [Candidatus Helarchaeota archaeon]